MKSGFCTLVTAFRLCALLAALLVLSAGMATPSQAAAPADGVVMADDYTEMSLEQLMAIPVYSAAKREQKSSEAPSSVTVITAQEIRAYGWRTLGELLGSTSGFYNSYTRTYGSVGVRGFLQAGDFGGRVLLLVNGHRMNDPLYDTAAFVEDFIVDLGMIDRVEIVRGPGSTLFGTNAFFAIVNVFTKTADQFEGAQAALEIGTFATHRGRLTFGATAENGTEVLVSASGYESDGKPEVYMPAYDDPGVFDGVLRNGDGEWARRFMGSLRKGKFALEGLYVGRDKDSPPGYGTEPDLPRHTFDGRGVVEGRYEWAFSETASVAARLYYDWYTYVGDYPYNVAAEGDPRELLTNRDESISESVGTEFQFNWQPTPEHTAAMGVEYRNNYRQLMMNLDMSEPREVYLDINPATRIVGLYLQHEYRPSARLGVTGGVRYDHYDSFGDAMSPRAAVVFKAFAQSNIKFLYGNAFRAPNANEFYYLDANVKRNPDLKPEEITTYEMVWEQQLRSNWQATASVFQNEVSELIDWDIDPVDDLYHAYNIGTARARGLELNVNGQLTQKASARASYTHTKTEDGATGEPLAYSPSHLIKFNATAPLVGDWLSGGLDVRHVSEKITPSGKVYNALWLFNTTLYTKKLKDSWGVSATVYNVFDTRYGNPVLGDLDNVQDGRTVRLKVSTDF